MNPAPPLTTFVFRPDVGNVLTLHVEAETEADARRKISFIIGRSKEWTLIGVRA